MKVQNKAKEIIQMKKIFNFAIMAGIIIIMAGAGGYETMSASFAKSFAIMMSGATLTAVGAVGKEKYIKYRKRCVMLAKKKRNALTKADAAIGANLTKIGCCQKV